MEATCALCKKEKVLKESHRIPKFVTKAIKKNSFTKKIEKCS